MRTSKHLYRIFGFSGNFVPHEIFPYSLKYSDLALETNSCPGVVCIKFVDIALCLRNRERDDLEYSG